MLHILYEDGEVIVVEKPVGMESQAAGGFDPDMVSEIRKHINKLCPTGKEPYVGVIHRLDKPVSGVMVYAKTQKAAASLSKQVQTNQMHKKYIAVVCGKPVDHVGNFVDYLLKDGKMNLSKIVEKGITGGKRAELSYRLLKTVTLEQMDVPEEMTDIWDGKTVSLVEIRLITGRHHQIRVQFAERGFPLWGDNRYNCAFCGKKLNKRHNIALTACELSFRHPSLQKIVTYCIEPEGEIFKHFK